MSHPLPSLVRPLVLVAALALPWPSFAQSSMTLREYPGRWEGSKSKLCDGGTLVEITPKTTADFTWRHLPNAVLLDSGAKWMTSPQRFTIPPGGYLESAYVRGRMQGPSKRVSVGVGVLVVEGDTGGAAFGARNTANHQSSSRLYRVMDAQTTYVNTTDHDVVAVAVLANIDEDWGGGDAIGQVLSTFIRPLDASAAGAGVGAGSITANTAGEAGNAIRVKLVGDGSGRTPSVSVDGPVITIHYDKALTMLSDVGDAIDANAAAKTLVTVEFGSIDPTTVKVSDVFLDPATIALADGSDAVPQVNGDVEGGVCVRSTTAKSEEEEDRELCKAEIAAAAPGYTPAATGTDLTTRVTALEAKPDPTCECGLERTGGGLFGCGSTDVVPFAALAFLVRRRRSARVA